ncbi:MAG TPA: DUF1667 domain-containing protein [Candidatus Caccovivens faecavium]|nr:DUF1667 domain-containing protein [Candidatus Caccovivens faecavium]
MEKRELTCIMCPLGCQLTVTIDGDNITVTGNNCKRGEVFGKEEVTCPMRIVTSSVKTEKGVRACKTSKPVPKSMIFDVMKEIEKLRLKNAKFGEVVIKNVLNTGADIVITANE